MNVSKVKLSKFFLQGVEAREAGETLADNPLLEGTKFFEEWNCGWVESDDRLRHVSARDAQGNEE